MASEDDLVELRGKCPKAIVDVLDAVAIANRCDRIDVVNDILLKWARKKVHESTVVGRVTNGNPRLTDSGWSALE